MTVTEKPLHETLDTLVTKLESIQAEKSNQMEDAAKITSNIDRLAEAIAHLEMTRARENKLAQKLDILTGQIENLTRLPYRGAPVAQKSLESTLRTLITGTRTVGQVIEIIANSIQLMFDSIIKTFNDYKVTTSGTVERGDKSNSLDLAKILDPINTLLRSMADKKNGGTQSAGGNEQQ
ncbi:hypothetical protein [Desulfotomaculum copahuensis]|uniref:Uncharacterized protein n=1 Tax=Desulfotomaculum copahuensis TaxID=1838280 RepID=A0A1B7LE08_9FIRM|nr:hypothetical protein [Desulfotomaculum copahuensis]OAT81338.1 hypothetical protein A6M21_10675 [Desulfotomaculum copahuensis]